MMKKITLFLTILITGVSFGQNFVAIGQVKGLKSNTEACEAGGKGVISYPNGWYTDSGVEIDPIYAGESSDSNWKWDQLVTDASDIYFNGETKTRAAYASSDTDLTAMISIDNTTDFTLKAFNKRASNNTLTQCAALETVPGNKVLRYSLMLNAALNPNDVRTVTITITDTNSVSENIVLTVTASPTLGLDEVDNKEDASISLYPNPARNYFTVNSTNHIEKIEVYNLLGQKVLTQTSPKVNVSNLTKGVYISKIYQENDIVSTKRFVKN